MANAGPGQDEVAQVGVPCIEGGDAGRAAQAHDELVVPVQVRGRVFGEQEVVGHALQCQAKQGQCGQVVGGRVKEARWAEAA
ncbi:MAG: hypothetical protein NZ482_01845 [Gloeomargarita sp. SKYG98]|nr:hypothetical protein [Gloeomargarita sp. SKYG98]